MAPVRSVSESTAAAYGKHRAYINGVLTRRCGWLDAGEREQVLHEAYATVLQKQHDGTLSLDDMSAPQIRAFLTQTSINKALDEGKRVGRKRSVPLADADYSVPDPGPAPEDVAAAGMESARVREIVGELSGRQQAIVKLRFFFDRSPAEIQGFLGISERIYRRELERALARVLSEYEQVIAGTFCDSRRSTIRALVAGVAGPQRAAAARVHIATCPACAAWAAQLRQAARNAGAVVVLPALDLSGTQFERLVQLAASIRDAVAHAATAVKHEAALATTRADQAFAGYFSLARPGTVAVAVAGCVTLGGGATYCALEGIPKPIRGLTGERQGSRGRGSRTTAMPTVAARRPASEARLERPPAATARPPVARRPKHPPAPPDPAEQKFGFELPASGGSAAPPAPPAPGPPGEFDP